MRKFFIGAAMLVLTAMCVLTAPPHAQTPDGGQKAPEVKRIVVNGTELAYVEAGRGEPVVLVHGSLSDYRVSLPLMNVLSGRYHVVNYSRRCHVPNPCPRNTNYSYETHADDLAALIRQLNLGPVHLVGHSYGGVVAALVARQHPGLVRRIVLVEPGLYSMIPQNDEGLLVLGEMVAAGERVRSALASELNEEAVRQIADFVFRPRKFAEVPAELRAILQENVASLRAAVVTAAPPPAFTCDEARQIRDRVLLAEGEKTAPEFRLVTDELARCLPSAERARIPGADHGLYYESAGPVGDTIVQFLTR